MEEAIYFVLWLLGLAFWTAVIGGGGYLLVRFVRAYERRSVAPADTAMLEERVRLLEEANLRLEGEIAQLAEAQQFTTRLLSERSPGTSDRSPPAPE